MLRHVSQQHHLALQANHLTSHVVLPSLAHPAASGPNWPEFQPLRPHGLSHLQQSTPLHVCPSEREGFGHYINEARAAGAVVIAPDHPPMNELVNATTGVLIRVNRTFSQPGPPEPALGRYGHISASVSPQVGGCVEVGKAASC